MTLEYSGFPIEGIRFLHELAQNNNRAWFEANKSRYENDLLRPAVDFVAAAGAGIKEFAPAINVDLRTNGSGCLIRIYRDTRFSKDKSPYKTAVAGIWWQGAGKKMQSPGFGFHLDPRGMELMAGIFQFDKAQLERYRLALADPKYSAGILLIADDFRKEQTYQLEGRHYKRPPTGVDPAAPIADLYLHDGLYARPNQAVPIEQVTSPEILEICLAHFRKMAPLQQWLAEVFADG